MNPVAQSICRNQHNMTNVSYCKSTTIQPVGQFVRNKNDSLTVLANFHPILVALGFCPQKFNKEGQQGLPHVEHSTDKDISHTNHIFPCASLNPTPLHLFQYK